MSRITSPTVTDNARLLLGYIAGALHLHEEPDYRLVDVDAAAGTQTFETVATGNLFRISVEQIGGTE